MTKFLLRLFVKDYGNTRDPRVHFSIGKMAGIVGIVCNILLFLGKLSVGLIAGSVSIIADGANNLSDAVSSVVTLLGFHLAQKPADEEHPFGHARYEYLSGLVVAFLILLMGVEMLKSSVGKIIHPELVEFTSITFVVLILSVGVKLWMAVFYANLGKRIRSATLRATSADNRNDVIATSCVLIGCLLGEFLSVNVDGFIGLGVAGFILYSGFNVAKETVSPLLGTQADEQMITKLYDFIRAREGIMGAHDLLIHDYGPGRYFASVHVEMSAEKSPICCHDIIDCIEQDVLEKWNVHLVIHYDPVPEDFDGQSEIR